MGCQRLPVKSVALLVAWTIVAVACQATNTAPTSSQASTRLTNIGAGLQGRSGLAASVYASGLKNVSAFAFDAAGRLWVATAAYEDDSGDGIFVVAQSGATPLEVVSAVHTPLGLVWLDDTLYVAAEGGVTAYTGFDGAGFKTTRTVLSLPSGVGEVNELAVAPDGRLWLGVSSPCDDCIPTSSGSAAVLSFLPDGSDLTVEASGIRAPVGLAFDSPTGLLYVTMNQRDDLGENTPGDWLATVSSGQNWGFPGCYGQGGTPCAGTPSPVAVLDPHGAVAGVAIIHGELGTGTGHAALVAEWALGKVQLVRLDGVGSGGMASAATSAAVEPFLTGVTSPVAVALGPDDAAYVGDWATGTIYRISGSANS
jgi:glucose/arabinose dehydrogenase